VPGCNANFQQTARDELAGIPAHAFHWGTAGNGAGDTNTDQRSGARCLAGMNLILLFFLDLACGQAECGCIEARQLLQRSPYVCCSQAIPTRTAVSARSTRPPNLTGAAFRAQRSARSASLQPPSGPTARARSVVVRPGLGASRPADASSR